VEVRAAELDELAQEAVERPLELGPWNGDAPGRPRGLAALPAAPLADLDADVDQPALAARLDR